MAGILVKKITLIFLLLIMSNWVNAKSVYLTDAVEINLRAGESETSEILATLPSGSELKFIQTKNSGYTKVRMSNKQYAFVLTKELMNQPSNKNALEKAKVVITKLKQENEALDAELLMSKGDSTAAKSSHESLTKESDGLKKELEELSYASTHVIKIKDERDTFQAKFIQSNKELEQMKLENQSLTANIELEWFWYGGSVVFFSILFGILLSKISWRKKAGNWDSRF